MGFPPDQKHVVRACPGEQPHQEPRVVKGGERQAATTAVSNFDVLESTLAGHSSQVYFEQSRQMGGVRTLLKGIELILQQERNLAQQAELVGGSDDDTTAR